MDGFSAFTFIEQALDESIKHLALYPVAILAGGVAMLAIPLLTMWTTYRIMLVFFGQVAEPFTSIMKEFGVRACILLLAASSSFLLANFHEPIRNTQEALTREFSKEQGGSVSVFEPIEKHINQVGALLEATMGVDKKTEETYVEEATRLNGGEPLNPIEWFWNSLKDTRKTLAAAADNLGGFFELMMQVLKLLIVGAALIALGVSCFIQIMLNKIFFMLGLGVSPLFIMFLAFESTRGWFTAWLSSTLGYCFSYPLAMLVVSTLLNIFDGIYKNNAFRFSDVFVCIVTSLCFMSLVGKIGNLSSSWFASTNIADGVAQSFSTMVSRTVGTTGKSAIMGAKGTLRSAELGAKGGYYTAKGGYKIAKGAYGWGKAIGSKGREWVTGKKAPPTIQVK